MEEIKSLLKENNEMLKYICSYIYNKNSSDYLAKEDLKDFCLNVIADIFVDKLNKNEK